LTVHSRTVPTSCAPSSATRLSAATGVCPLRSRWHVLCQRASPKAASTSRSTAGPCSARSVNSVTIALPSDAVGLQRLEAVEGDRGVGRGVGAGRADLEPVADLQVLGQAIVGALVEDV